MERSYHHSLSPSIQSFLAELGLLKFLLILDLAHEFLDFDEPQREVSKVPRGSDDGSATASTTNAANAVRESGLIFISVVG